MTREQMKAEAESKQPEWYRKLKLTYEVEAKCDDCGEDIEEAHYTNEEGKSVHVTSATNGHYYSNGSVACDGCHEGAR